MPRNIFLKWFLVSAGVMLCLTGAAKIWTAFGNVKILIVVDPFLSIEFRHLLLAVGVAELVLGLACFFNKGQTVTAILLACFTTNLLAYRLGLWWINWRTPCNCLGNLTDVLHIPPQTADTAMKIILAYLLIGSYATLFWLWRQQKREISTSMATQ
jgi:hypothetical protein